MPRRASGRAAGRRVGRAEVVVGEPARRLRVPAAASARSAARQRVLVARPRRPRSVAASSSCSRRAERVVDPPLALAHQPDDHCPAPIAGAGGSPCPSSAFSLASSSSTWLPCVICASWRSRSSPCAVKSSSAPDAGQLVDRGRPRLHLLGLVLRALDREPDVGHVLADPGRGLADLDLRLGGRVLGLDHFLLRAERLDLRLERLLAADQLLLLVGELLALLLEPVDLAPGAPPCA